MFTASLDFGEDVFPITFALFETERGTLEPDRTPVNPVHR
jgi:hypothetical protein